MGFFDDIGDLFTDATDPITQALGISKTEGEKAAQRNLEAFQGNKPPEISDVQFQAPQAGANYQNFVSETGPTSYNDITVDPTVRAAQMQALQKLQQLGEGGLTATDKAALAGIQQTEATQAQGQRQALLQNAASRGIGGSGLEAQSLLNAGQNAATNRSLQDVNVLGNAQQRALAALVQGGQLGQSIENQQYGEAANRANAQDIINRFNASNMTEAGAREVAARNERAQQAAQVANQQTIQNQLLNPQTRFENMNQYLSNVAGQRTAQGAAKGARINNSLVGNVQQGINQGVQEAGKNIVGAGTLALF